jgi:hypothetical protein
MQNVEIDYLTVNEQKNIELAKKPEDAIELISNDECEEGLHALQKIFIEKFPDPSNVSVIPILRSGARLGDEITKPLGIPVNPMRMSYYAPDTSRLPDPICLIKPDISQICSPDGKTKPVVFAECVVDSQGTILASMNVINGMIDDLNKKGGEYSYPEYYTFAYVSKTGNKPVQVPNIVVAFHVHPDIWVGGRGCDLPGDAGREFNNIVGIISPFAKVIPEPPYFTPTFTTSNKETKTSVNFQVADSTPLFPYETSTSPSF